MSVPDFKAVSHKFWDKKVDGGHRYSTEEWLGKYSDELLSIVGCGGTLVDVGCGACQVTTYLAKKFEVTYAVDFSQAMLAAARERVRTVGATNIDILSGSMQSLPPAIGSADVVVSYGVAQYLGAQDLAEHLKECRRILSPGGVVCIGLIPDRQRREWYYQEILSPRVGGWLGGVKQWLSIHMKKVYGFLSNDFIWDNIGNWFAEGEIMSIAAGEGFEAECIEARYYEYRFHARLTLRVGL